MLNLAPPPRRGPRPRPSSSGKSTDPYEPASDERTAVIDECGTSEDRGALRWPHRTRTARTAAPAAGG
eukprot:3154595-Prymnesium_polylepis.1